MFVFTTGLRVPRKQRLSLLLFRLVVQPMHEGTLNAQWAREDLELLKYEKNKYRPRILPNRA